MNDTELTEAQVERLVGAALHDAIMASGPIYDAGGIYETVRALLAARVAAARADALAPVLALADDMGCSRLHTQADVDSGQHNVWCNGATWSRATVEERLRAAVADPEPQEAPNTCPSCALGQHRCTRDLAPCDCRECA